MTHARHVSETVKLARLRELHKLSPGKSLDMKADSSDVQLSREASERILGGVAMGRRDWTEFLAEAKHPLARAIAERTLLELELMEHAAYQVEGEQDNSDRLRALEEKLFDYYDPNLFYAALDQKITELDMLRLPPELEMARVYVLETLEGLRADGEAGVALEKPTPKTLHDVHDWINGQFDDIFDEIDQDDTEKYTASQAVGYFNKAIGSTPVMRDAGWVAEEIVREKGGVSVYASEKKVVVPTTREMTPIELKKLLVHEVFGHALRSAMAEAAGLEVGQHGTATYARFEESFMIALEQCLSEKYDPTRGINHYLAVGLAVTKGMSQEEIGHLFKSLHMIRLSSKGISEETIEKSERLAAGQLRRTFAGMTDVDEGVAHRKDIDYLHGLNDSWKLLNYAAHHGIVDATLRWILSAKFNPFTPAERAYVNTRNPMPVELEPFFAAREMTAGVSSMLQQNV